MLLLLQSSDRVAHDLTEAFSHCEPPCTSGPPPAFRPCLVLKPWYDLRPEREFRCFARGHRLVGVSQRDMTQHYPQLLSEQESLLELLSRFHRDHVQGRFPLQDYTYDVYVTPKGSARILDFNPWAGVTSALLFDWDELRDMDEALVPMLRLTPADAALIPGKRAMYGVPYDLVANERTVGEMIEQIQLNQQRRQEQEDLEDHGDGGDDREPSSV